MTRTAARRLLFAVVLAVQLVALYAPRAPSTGSGWGLDKVVHAALFAGVVWTGRRAGLPPVWLVVLCAVHAPVSELIQGYLLPHRDGTVGDALADLAGVAAGALLPVPRGNAGPGRMDR